MALSESFQEIVDALPRDWTDMQVDLRITDETRYVDASIPMTQINAQPYSEADWHWRINVAHGFGHGASPGDGRLGPARCSTARRSRAS